MRGCEVVSSLSLIAMLERFQAHTGGRIEEDGLIELFAKLDHREIRISKRGLPGYLGARRDGSLRMPGKLHPLAKELVGRRVTINGKRQEYKFWPEMNGPLNELEIYDSRYDSLCDVMFTRSRVASRVVDDCISRSIAYAG